MSLCSIPVNPHSHLCIRQPLFCLYHNIDLSFLEYFSKCKHTVCTFLGLASFAWHDTFEIHSFQLLPFLFLSSTSLGFPGGLADKEQPASAGDARDLGLIPGWGRCPGVGNGNPLQYSCLEKSMNRERSLARYSPVGHRESDTTEHTHTSWASADRTKVL